jgi:hypothetical protein
VKRFLLAAAILTGLAGAAHAQTCPTDTLGDSASRISEDGKVLAWRLVPAKIVVGQPFAVEVVACIGGRPPTRIRVDAGMPAHGHGMNYTPAKREIAPGHAAFDGLVFHMPGRWQLTFDLYDGAARERLTQDIVVRP